MCGILYELSSLFMHKLSAHVRTSLTFSQSLAEDSRKAANPFKVAKVALSENVILLSFRSRLLPKRITEEGLREIDVRLFHSKRSSHDASTLAHEDSDVTSYIRIMQVFGVPEWTIVRSGIVVGAAMSVIAKYTYDPSNSMVFSKEHTSSVDV